MYRIRGPKGHLVVRHATLARVRQALPALVKRFGKVSVENAPAATSDVRARIVAFCKWGIDNESAIHYSQQRPMERLKTVEQLTQLPRFADCSEFATDAYAYARAPDPNGNGYDGTGATGTLLGHCRHIPRTHAKPGDLIVFGPGAGNHVVVLLESGNSADPLVCSHGQEKGPIAIRLSAEAAAQAGPVTFLTCLD